MGNNIQNVEIWRPKIQEKLNKEKIKNSHLYEEIKETFGMEINEFIYALGDKKIFKEKFLISHYKMYNLLQSINTEIDELRKRDLTEIEVQDAVKKLYQKKLELSESRIEIFFCNAMDKGHEFIKFCAETVMTFGLIHTGILIDDVVIQWGRGMLGDSLIHPAKTVKYNDYIYAIELENREIWDLIKETFNNITDYIKGTKKYEEMGTLKAFKIADSQLDSIAESCVYYNINKNYSLVFENCQHFVKNILNKIKLRIIKDGEVGRILKIAQDKGDIIDFVYKDKKFNSRNELDDYILKCNFKQLPNDHRRLLFCYRNVFEYYSRYRKEDKYKTTEKAKDFWKSLSYTEKFE